MAIKKVKFEVKLPQYHDGRIVQYRKGEGFLHYTHVPDVGSLESRQKNAFYSVCMIRRGGPFGGATYPRLQRRMLDPADDTVYAKEIRDLEASAGMDLSEHGPVEREDPKQGLLFDI